MIGYYEQSRTFLLQGKGYSYAAYVDEAGFLQHVYFGGRITAADVPYLASVGETPAPKTGDLNFDMEFDNVPSEYGFFARGDFREPSVILAREEGESMSRLRYLRHAIVKGAPQWKGIPCARTGDDTLCITLKDDFSDTEIDLYYTASEDSDVLVRNAVVRNTGKTPVQLKKAFSFCFELPVGKYSALRLGGRWGGERTPQLAPLAHGVTRLHSLRGASSHITNPFLGILKEGCGEENGECYGVQLCYSGSFAITAEYAQTAPLRLQGGINDVAFSWEFPSGEAFVTPQAFLCYSDTGVGGMSRSFARFLRDKVVSPRYAQKPRPIVVNNWEATYLDFTYEKLYLIIDEGARLGADTFVLDDGWFGERNDLTAGLGDWKVNRSKLPQGLTPIIERCKEKGLKFGLWFEPEMVNEKSALYKAHPDYAIQKWGVEPCRSRNQLVLDFSRKEVVDCIYEQMRTILQTHDIAYIKWDMNRNITESFSASLPAHRQGEFMHRYILGVYDLAERITTEFPDLFMEGCASGGGRFDAGMLYYFPQIWTSDVTDGYERTRIQWGTSLCYPLSSMSCHVSACPNHQTERTTPLATRGAIASLGATGYELDLSNLSEREKAQVKEQIAAYKEIESLILEGELYRLLDPFTQGDFCQMVVSKDKAQAYVVGERTRGEPYCYQRFLRLQGLDEKKIYFVAELNQTLSGSALMRVGLPLPCLRDYEAWVWNLREVSL